ncbi:aminopeptidase N [Sinomonas atrocyanea]|uniref:M1 family metallopeptidase n=1 Tax=Sinomonas atrocyanea TaxID=37927 RepID=UPI00278411F3|nr:M1 family metallopeptidase [Sinomonas atrocyanea]MDP9883578.1 aminopeptidase N [Sinomonas atrocyanea]
MRQDHHIALPMPPGRPALPDPYTPGHGSAAYTVTHYDLDLEVKLASNRLAGRARLRATANQRLEAITLSLAGLRVLKVQVEGARAKAVQRGEELRITPATPVPAGRDFSLEIRYEGSPGPTDGEWGDVGWEELEDGVLVAGQPVGAPTWFPCNDHPSQKATFRISATADAGYRVVSNGLVVGHRRKASRETWVYEVHEPMAPYLATLLIGRFQLLELGRLPRREHPSVGVFAAVPPALRESALAGLRDQQAMLALFTDLFGPYPFRDYTVVVTEDELEIPLEAQTLSIVGRNHITRSWESQRLLAHELAHQWFGNSVTARRWEDIWLHEGFACYAEWLWSEHAGQGSVASRAAAAWKLVAWQEQDLVIGAPGPAMMFDDRVYKRGALALHAVRNALGEDRFFRALRAFGEEYRHGNASTADFLELLGRVGAGAPGFDAAAILRPWLFEGPLPPLPA